MGTKTRRRQKALPPRPRNALWPCKNCRVLIVWATIDLIGGTTRKLVCNAEPHPRGRYEYVAGSIQRPRLRELDVDEQLYGVPKADRFNKHFCGRDGSER